MRIRSAAAFTLWVALAQPLQGGPQKYEHVGLVSFSPANPDYTLSVDGQSAHCYEDSRGAECYSKAATGVFRVILDDGVTKTLVLPDKNSFPLQDLFLDNTQPDKHFRYRLADVTNRYTHQVDSLLCTPGRDKKGKETSKEVCYSYF